MIKHSWGQTLHRQPAFVRFPLRLCIICIKIFEAAGIADQVTCVGRLAAHHTSTRSVLPKSTEHRFHPTRRERGASLACWPILSLFNVC